MVVTQVRAYECMAQTNPKTGFGDYSHAGLPYFFVSTCFDAFRLMAKLNLNLCFDGTAHGVEDEGRSGRGGWMYKRQEGWYWVKVGRDRKWHCGYWDAEFSVWDVPTFLCRQQPDDMADIGPRIPTPDEPWKVVPTTASRSIEDAITRSRNLKACEIWEDALAAAPKPRGDDV